MQVVTTETRKALEDLINKRLYFKKSTLSSTLILFLYPEKKLSTKDIIKELELKKSFDYRKLYFLVNKQIINRELSDGRYVYSLTQLGRWYYVSIKLNIRFPVLCCLAMIYVVQSKMEKPNKLGFFPIPMFTYFDDIIASKFFLKNSFTELQKQKITYRYGKKTRRIYHNMMKMLSENFDTELREVHQWLLGDFWKKKNEILENDPLCQGDLKEYNSSLVAKMVT